MRKYFLVLSLLVLLSMVVGACGPTPATATQAPAATEPAAATAAPTEAPATEPPAPEGPKTIHANFGVGDVPTIDPALSTDTTSVQVVDETTVGLTRQNEVTTESEPGMA